jgi:hypothetical protein
VTALDQNTSTTDQLRGLESMCAALHAATETDPLVKEVAWRTFALIRAHREQTAEVDRLTSERDQAFQSAKNMGGALGKVGEVIDRAIRTAIAHGDGAGMAVLIEYVAEAGLLPESAVQVDPQGGA